MHSRHAPPLSEFTLREYQPGDEHEILATFNRVFAAVDPTFRPRTLASWRWQFLGNPSGSCVLLALSPEGRVVAQLANVLQRVHLLGRAATFSQAVDSMSDPAFRIGLRRASLQAVLGNHYAERYAGPAPGQHALLWGAPVATAWRVGRQLIRYEVIRTQQKLAARPADVDPRPAAGIEVETVERFPAEVAELDERAARAHGAIAVRDAAQLDWRFVAHPERRYRIGLARDGGELRGYAVFARGGFDGEPDVGLVCDWLVAPGERGAERALFAWLAVEAARAGVERLVAVVPDTSAAWLAFQEAGFRVAPTRYTIVGRRALRGFDMRWMHGHWYYTLGDTDLV
jgi:hypothetical protein